jgi:hypothetical protein
VALGLVSIAQAHMVAYTTYVYESMVAKLVFISAVYYADDLSNVWAEVGGAQGSRRMRSESSMDGAHGLLACAESRGWPRDGDGWQAIDNYYGKLFAMMASCQRAD